MAAMAGVASVAGMRGKAIRTIDVVWQLHDETILFGWVRCGVRG
jgi:hypothetical protein